MQPTRSPLASLTAIYLISLPLAWAVTPHGGPWDAVAAGCAMGLGWMMGLAPWWLAINAVFMPALSWIVTLELSPGWALGALATLMLVYGPIWRNRVPLFFSSARAQQALAALIPSGQHTFLDVGCGDGRVLAGLAAARPDCRFEGVEQAWVPWLLARMRCWAGKKPYRVRHGDLWTCDLAGYDMVYAYLSPAVMTRLWEKAKREMRPGAILVGVFAIPGVAPARTVDIRDTMHTHLHVWRIAPGRSMHATENAARRAPRAAQSGGSRARRAA
jgi:SAM-dependent methyltransferase